MKISEYFYSTLSEVSDINKPQWAEKIERWYQLDETSKAICEALYFWKMNERIQSFEVLYFVSHLGSNAADIDFCRNFPSPAKFVYTLANIGAAFACQMLNWSGPVYSICLAEDLEFDSMKIRIKNDSDQLLWDLIRSKNECALVLGTSPRLNVQGERRVWAIQTEPKILE